MRSGKTPFFLCKINVSVSIQVYRGVLSNGQVVAIKKAQNGSNQGGLEFKTEIELLSRVHHKNLLGLVGFCFEQGHQMLVYEFMSNGTLRESLSGKVLEKGLISLDIAEIMLMCVFV